MIPDQKCSTELATLQSEEHVKRSTNPGGNLLTFLNNFMGCGGCSTFASHVDPISLDRGCRGQVVLVSVRHGGVGGIVLYLCVAGSDGILNLQPNDCH